MIEKVLFNLGVSNLQNLRLKFIIIGFYFCHKGTNLAGGGKSIAST